MATIRDLKKDINYILGEIIEMALDWEKDNPKADKASSTAVIDEAISVFDALNERVNQKHVENKKAHFKSISNELEQKGTELITKVNAL